MFGLSTKSGATNGTSWCVGERPLLLGRGSACDVRILDPAVSRKHCELFVQDKRLHLRDLGSINRVIVNGNVTGNCILRVGDELRVGSAVFLVTADGASASIADPPSHPYSTVSLAEDESALLSAGTAGRAFESGSGLEELADLFAISRSISRSSSLDAVQQELAKALHRRFQPDRCCLFMLRNADMETINLMGEPCQTEPDHPINEIVRIVLAQKRGGLFPIKVNSSDVWILAAPICLGTHEIGALAVGRRTANQPYGEKDVDFLVALSSVIAPFFRAFERMDELEIENKRLRVADTKLRPLIGSSQVMKTVQETIKAIAPSLQTVLILGETGTGKELVARMIHELSLRSERGMVTVNCAAIPRELFESELFGHEKGAFTGAISRKVGLLEQSDGGTLFLDEIGDLSLDNQARILRAVETGGFRRVGGVRELEAHLRVLAATNKDLLSEMRQGRFREDLYHRLKAIEVRIPPLRERRYDIPELAAYFLSLATGGGERHFSGDAIEYLMEQKWPGNVRELKNTVQVVATVCRADVIQAKDVRAIVNLSSDSSVPGPLDEVEKSHILKTMDYCGGKVLEAAKLLGISKSSLYSKLAQYGR